MCIIKNKTKQNYLIDNKSKLRYLHHASKPFRQFNETEITKTNQIINIVFML